MCVITTINILQLTLVLVKYKIFNMTELERRETELDIRFRLWKSFELYAKYCLKVQTVEGELVNFELNEVQKVLQRIIKHIRENGRLIRLVILKARREGVSTWATGRFYWKTSMNKNRYAVIIAHEPEAKDFLFNMVKRYHNHCLEEFKPEDKYNNKAILEFNNDKGTGLDSAIRVGCAGKEDFGSGMKIDFLHISELSKWDRNIIAPLLTSLFQTVPAEPSTEVIIESTAKGVGGEFYDRFWGSRYRYSVFLNDKGEPDFVCEVNESADENNEYSSVFIPCFVFNKYRRPVPEGFTHTEEELLLKKEYNVPDTFLAWRRWCIANNCRGSIEIFKQEYPMNALEAFQSDSVSVFDQTKLREILQKCKEPVAYYDVSPALLDVIMKPKGNLKVWEEPSINKAYILSADVSEGLEGDKKDFSSIDIIDWLTGAQVAHWHGKISPDLLSRIVYTLARRYNNAFVVIERNNHGLGVISRLLDLGYTNMYVEVQHEPPNRPRKRYGWVTTSATKPLIIDNLIAEVRDGVTGIQNADTVKEMFTFKETEKGELEAELGHHDDRVISYAIAKYVRSKNPIPRGRIGVPKSPLKNGFSGKKDYSSSVWS